MNINIIQIIEETMSSNYGGKPGKCLLINSTVQGVDVKFALNFKPA